jgi:hypothetical protein
MNVHDPRHDRHAIDIDYPRTFGDIDRSPWPKGRDPVIGDDNLGIRDLLLTTHCDHSGTAKRNHAFRNVSRSFNDSFDFLDRQWPHFTF